MNTDLILRTATGHCGFLYVVSIRVHLWLKSSSAASIKIKSSGLRLMNWICPVAQVKSRQV